MNTEEQLRQANADPTHVAEFFARKFFRLFRLGRLEFEDLRQDIIVKLLKARRTYDPTKGVWFGYAKRAAWQALRDATQHWRRDKPAGFVEFEDERHAVEADPGDIIDARMLLASLPEKQRRAIEAWATHDKIDQELASDAGTTLVGFRMRRRKGLAKLQEKVTHERNCTPPRASRGIGHDLRRVGGRRGYTGKAGAQTSKDSTRTPGAGAYPTGEHLA